MKTSNIEHRTSNAESRKQTARLTADMDGELFRQLKSLLVGRGETIQEWVEHQARMEVAKPRLEKLRIADCGLRNRERKDSRGAQRSARPTKRKK